MIKYIHVYLILTNNTWQYEYMIQVIGKELFCVLKEIHGKDFQGFISEKITSVAGDITEKNLGIRNDSLAQTMMEEIDVVVNVVLQIQISMKGQ